MRRWLLRWLLRLALFAIVVVAAPILYVEFACRGTPISQAEATLITDEADQRAEARTYLTYPEWHIVYAYEGYAEAVAEEGQPHDFPYLSSIWGFWSALCALTERADELGAAGSDAKLTIYTIGGSFTLEMLAKAAYEETIGRAFTYIGTSATDAVEEEMAREYARFLQQTPWYRFNFAGWRTRLFEPEAANPRDWERRIALAIEWSVKQAYARIIEAGAGALGADELTMLVALRGYDPAATQGIEGVELVSEASGVTILRVPRYRIFATIATRIAQEGGDFVEIAGNDDILVSILGETAPQLPTGAEVVSATRRPGFTDRRYLVSTKVSALSELLRSVQRGALEHIYDY